MNKEYDLGYCAGVLEAVSCVLENRALGETLADVIECLR